MDRNVEGERRGLKFSTNNNICRGSIGGSGVRDDKTIINQIMLQFRPIAPKPVNQDSGCSSSKSFLPCPKKRTKRKYVTVRNNNDKKKKTRSDNSKKKVATTSTSNDSNHQEISKIRVISKEEDNNTSCNNDNNNPVTLLLLPETTDNDSRCLDLSISNDINVQQQTELHGYHHQQPQLPPCPQLNHRCNDQVAAVRDQKAAHGVVESWVTVECVTDTHCSDMGCCGGTDLKIVVKKSMEDGCPWFVSDGSNNVKWVNGAYKRMVLMNNYHLNNEDSIIHQDNNYNYNENNNYNQEVIVRLIMKEKVLPYLYSYSAFTCWVRLQWYNYCNSCENRKEDEGGGGGGGGARDTWRKERVLSSQMVPCDVWRLGCGGFAWRLDVEAALSLGR